MDLLYSAEDERLRAEIREFLAAALTPDLRDAGLNCTSIYCEYPVANRWYRIWRR